MDSLDINGMVQRGLRAIRLDRTVFQELAANRSLTNEAISIVVIVSIIVGIGQFLDRLLDLRVGPAIIGLIFTPITTLILFLVWTALIYFVGTSFFRGQADDFTQVMRPLGYAYAPQALSFFSFIPCLGGIAGLVGTVLMIVAGFIATRESLKLDDTNTLLTIIISIIVYAIVSAIFALIGLGGATVAGLVSR